MNRIEQLEAEIARLRAVCEEHDIDPDWVDEPYKPIFGPPTALQARFDALMVNSTRYLADKLAEELFAPNPLLNSLMANRESK